MPRGGKSAGVECVAIYNRTRAKAEALAREFGIPAVYDDAEQLLREVKPDFVDNITEVGGHKPLSLLCAKHRIPCICQKPMAASLTDAREMVAAFRKAKTPFFVHENWRWQAPMMALRKRSLAASSARRSARGSRWFPVSIAGPTSRRSPNSSSSSSPISARIFWMWRACCFGEANILYCQTHRTLVPRVKGENVATLLLSMGAAQTSVMIEMGYAKTPLEPGTRMFPANARRSSRDRWVRSNCALTTSFGSRRRAARKSRATRRRAMLGPIPPTTSRTPASSPCNANLLAALRGEAKAETTGEDNLKTLELVFGCLRLRPARCASSISTMSTDPRCNRSPLARRRPIGVSLRAGPLRMVFEGGDLRYIMLGEREIIRRIYAAVRDRNWATVPSEISDLQANVEPDQLSYLPISARTGATRFTLSGGRRLTGQSRRDDSIHVRR